MDYPALVAAITSYTENTFPATTLPDGSTVSSTTQINRFIQQAELRIFNTVQFPSLRKNVTGIASGQYVNCPADFLSVYSIATIDATGTYNFLLPKDVNFIREAYPSPTALGAPRYYALFGPSSVDDAELVFLLGPTPDLTYQVELHYFYYPESITTAGTTWLGDNFDSVLLYGSLVEANTYMKGESDMQALYETKYKEALAMAKRLGDGLERSDSYRNGQFRMPPLPQNSGVQ